MRVPVILLALVALFCACSAQNCPSNPDKVVVCYYASWSVYRNDTGQFYVSHIDPTLCTHLVYTFAGLDLNSKITSLDPNRDFTEGSYSEFTKQLKVANPCVKTLLAIGGWNEGSKKYSVMSYTKESREAFADSVLRYLVAYDFDGLDVDWEYPTERGGLAVDKENFVELMKVLHEKLKIWDLMLTMAVPISRETIQKAYDMQRLAPYVDYVLLMSYDFTNSASTTTGLSAPLSPIMEAIDQLLTDLPAEKLILGIATYGRSYTLEKSTSNGVGANVSGQGEPGKYTDEKGFLSYYELMEKLFTNRYRMQVVDGTYYAYYNLEWFTFDLLDTYTSKIQYAMEKNLRGIMVWTIDTDDFRGTYNNNITYPILRAVNSLLNGE